MHTYAMGDEVLTMLSLEEGRHAMIRDLDATNSRLRDIQLTDWERATPNEGWTVRQLAAHLGGSVQVVNNHFAELIGKRTGEGWVAANQNEISDSTEPAEIAAILTHHRNALFQTLSQLTEEDLEATLDPAKKGEPADTGQRLLAHGSFEFGLHRYDLESAMGEVEAGVTAETVAGAVEMIGGQLASIAEEHGTAPPEPIGYRLQGQQVDFALSWDGSRWQDEAPDSAPVTRISGDDGDLVLFLCGRIPADSERLQVDGDMEAARQFKTYVPGP